MVKKTNQNPEPSVTEDQNKINNAIQNLDISTSLAGKVSVGKSLKGKSITLNQKAESFFGTSNKSIWLGPKTYSMVVPDTITPEEEIEVNNAISLGILVEGNTYIPPIDKDPKVLQEYWSLIKTHGLSPSDPKCKSFPKFSRLLKKPIDRNWTAKEITNYCIQEETKYKNREKIIGYLKAVHINADCPNTLLEQA